MNRDEIDPEKFQESITNELDIVKNRVRNLIGSANWAEEGRYKEAILRNVIRRFLPSCLSLGTGFIIRKNNHDTKISRQIDIIVYDNTIPVLFSEGNFVITTYKNVKAIIEVKTKISNHDLHESINKSKENGKLINKNKKIFNGIFSYEYNDGIESDSIDNALKNAEGYVNYLSLGKDIFIKFWEKEDRNRLHPNINNCEGDFYNIYNLRGLSFSYFISNLICMTCGREIDDRWWFLFPIEGTKERYRERIICL